MTAADLRGWYLLGPMVTVHARHAETSEEAEALVDETVLAVWPVTGKELERMGEVACAVCGEPV